MDIIFLLERLESQIATGAGVPGTRKAFVDRDAVLELIDQLRVAIPEEVQAAKRINAEGEQILEKASEEASRIVSRAQEQAAFLISERGLTEEAAAEGRRIVEAAEAAGREVAEGADGYAMQVLLALQTEAEKALAAIHKGIEVLDDRRAQLRGFEPSGNGTDGAPAMDEGGVELGTPAAEEVGSRSSPVR
jgi:cell division septum initiation protein DivIVA